jgi:hypothetical protein
MKGLKRLFLGRSQRMLLWCAAKLPPVRWLVSILVVRQGRSAVLQALCDESPLPARACKRVSRRVRRSSAMHLLERRARKAVRAVLRRL